MDRKRSSVRENQEANVDLFWRNKQSPQYIDNDVEHVYLDDLSEISLPVPYPWLGAKDDVVPFQIAPEYYFDDCFGTPEAPHGYPISPLFDLVGSLYSDSPPPSPLSSTFSTPISAMTESSQLPSPRSFDDHADARIATIGTHSVPGGVEVSPTSYTPALSPTVSVSSLWSTPYPDGLLTLPSQAELSPHFDGAHCHSSRLGLRPSDYVDTSCPTSHRLVAQRLEARRDRRHSPYPSSLRRHSYTFPSPEEDISSSDTSSISSGHPPHSSGFASFNKDKILPKNAFGFSVGAWESSSGFSSSASRASIQTQQPVALQPHHSRMHSHPYRRPPAKPGSPGSSTALPYDPSTQTSPACVSPIPSIHSRTQVRQLNRTAGRRKRAKPQALKLESYESEEGHGYDYRGSPLSPLRSTSPNPHQPPPVHLQESPSKHSRGQNTPVLVSPSVDPSWPSTSSNAPAMPSPATTSSTKRAPLTEHKDRGTRGTSFPDHTSFSSLIVPAPTPPLPLSIVVKRSDKRAHADEDDNEDGDYVFEDEIEDDDDDGDEYKPEVKPFETCRSTTRRNAAASPTRKDSTHRRTASITKRAVELPASTPVTSCTTTSAHLAGPSTASNDSRDTSISIHRTPHMPCASPDYSPLPSASTAHSNKPHIPSFKRRGGKTRYSCVYCTMDFSRRNDVYRHMSVTHCEAAATTEFVCVCGKVLSRGDALRRHRRTCDESRSRNRRADTEGGASRGWKKGKKGKGVVLHVKRRAGGNEDGNECGLGKDNDVSVV